MEKRELKSIIEALLFTWGDPIEIKDIASIIEKKENEVEELIEEMINEFDYNRRALGL